MTARFLSWLSVVSGVENPESTIGCYACQPDDYDRFSPFFSAAITRYHSVKEDVRQVKGPPLSD